MQPSDVTAYGCDYSEREFTPSQLDAYPGVRIEWLARYVGYPGNVKCISHYPGAYRAHRDAGRPVVLYHQVGYRDFEGGYASGRAHAQTALDDARSDAVGWDGETPIVACFDRRMPAFTRNGVYYRAIWLDEVRDYAQGFTSVLGYHDAGFYGFDDAMGPCVAEDWVRFRLQCGARSSHVPGISAWQENNEQPVLLGTQTDRLELYVTLADLGGDTVSEADVRNGLAGWNKYDLAPGTDQRELLQDLVTSALIPINDPETGDREDQLGSVVGAIDRRLVRVEDVVGELKTSGVPVKLTLSPEDQAAIVRGVLDGLDARARDGDPTTGPVT